MKTVILAGGYGTRLAEYTQIIPKPMVPIGGRPMLLHIMHHYAKYGHKDFYIALGYKGNLIKEYFLNYFSTNSDFTVDLATGEISTHGADRLDWRVTLIDTGESSMTGGRIGRLEKYIKDGPFLLTYGDGLSDINIEDLIAFHQSHGKMVTVTAVHPDARFGELKMGEDNMVERFAEKPQLDQGWINGGFFVMEPGFLDYIDGDDSILEKQPLERAAREGELVSFKHHGFWRCMDTKRDHDSLEQIWQGDNPPWA
ncbi:MAG: glucose-1-phosphate cytidylyltransferase [bacterium]